VSSDHVGIILDLWESLRSTADRDLDRPCVEDMDMEPLRSVGLDGDHKLRQSVLRTRGDKVKEMAGTLHDNLQRSDVVPDRCTPAHPPFGHATRKSDAAHAMCNQGRFPLV
jgi:hypothetical protein